MGRSVWRGKVPAIADDVRDGLTTSPKRLPEYLFYDALGSALYERITELPEYYPTRTERKILATHATAIATRLTEDGPITVFELGAGTATKTELVLRALMQRQASVVFVPIDVSEPPIREAESRLAKYLPGLVVEPLVASHEAAFSAIAARPGRKAVLFIGSSIGNFAGAAAVELLAGVRRSVAAGDLLLLGTDRVKPLEILLPAYDDAQGVTAAFDKNVLARINRELGGRFDLDAFRHIALWNEPESRIEMHLESVRAQSVRIEGLGLTVRFEAGERIHTESSVKYDSARVDALLRSAGFERLETFEDERRWFGVHLARAS